MFFVAAAAQTWKSWRWIRRRRRRSSTAGATV